MTLALRRVYVAITILFFALLAPTLLAYTAGYRFDPSGPRFVRTATLRIDSEPRDADVILGGERTNRRTPAQLKGLSPGSYEVELLRSGYRNQRATVELQPGQAKILGPLALFLESQPLLVQAEGKVRSLSDDGRSIVISKASAESPLLSVQRIKGTSLFSTNLNLSDEASFSWSVNGESVFVLDQASTLPLAVSLPVKEGGKSFDLSGLAGGSIRMIAPWKDNLFLALTEEGVLLTFDADAGGTRPLRSNVRAAIGFEDEVITVQSDGRLAAVPPTAQDESSDLVLKDPVFLGAAGSTVVVLDAQRQETLIVERRKGQFTVVSRLPVALRHAHGNRDRLLLIGDNEVWIFSPERGPELILRRAEKFLDGFWLNQNLFLVSAENKLLAVDLGDPPIITTLLTEFPHATFRVDRNGKNAFLVQEGQLYELSLR